MTRNVRLGVNIDHVATLRNARGGMDPNILQMALAVEEAGADGVTIHLREDRRHIRDADVDLLITHLRTPMNLEIAATDTMIEIAGRVRPHAVCLVPEHRLEVTTEGGLDVAGQNDRITDCTNALKALGIRVSLFIDPNPAQIDAAAATGAPVIELHTVEYANASHRDERAIQLMTLTEAVGRAKRLGLEVHAGHGLTKFNVKPVAAIAGIEELNIGHSLVARALMVGLPVAVGEFKQLIREAVTAC